MQAACHVMDSQMHVIFATCLVDPFAGTYAEYATIKSNLLASIPDGVSFDQAAALPLVSLTAIQVCQTRQQLPA